MLVCRSRQICWHRNCISIIGLELSYPYLREKHLSLILLSMATLGRNLLRVED
jgi:hypothetical protein